MDRRTAALPPTPAPEESLDGDTRPQRRAGLRFEPLEDGCALYIPGADRIFHLNVAASCLWTGCDGRRSIREMVREMAGSLREGAPSPAHLERDIRRALENLADAGLVVFNGPGDEFPLPPRDGE